MRSAIRMPGVGDEVAVMRGRALPYRDKSQPWEVARLFHRLFNIYIWNFPRINLQFAFAHQFAVSFVCGSQKDRSGADRNIKRFTGLQLSAFRISFVRTMR